MNEWMKINTQQRVILNERVEIYIESSVLNQVDGVRWEEVQERSIIESTMHSEL